MKEKYYNLLEIFKNLILAKFGKNITSLILYGSLARGNLKKESDIDLLIVTKEFPKEYDMRVKLTLPLVEEWENTKEYKELLIEGYEPQIKFIIFNEEEALRTKPLYLDLVEDAVILYDKRDFFKKKLDVLRTRMRELGSKRIFLEDGSWYWDLNPNLKPGEVLEL